MLKKKHPLQSYFFKKFQEQVSKAPGFKPLLSYEDFLKILEDTNAKSDTNSSATNT